MCAPLSHWMRTQGRPDTPLQLSISDLLQTKLEVEIGGLASPSENLRGFSQILAHWWWSGVAGVQANGHSNTRNALCIKVHCLQQWTHSRVGGL